MSVERELLADIMATASILIKFGHDDILESKALFIRFLAELKFAYNGKPIDEYSFITVVGKITPHDKKELINEFLKGHEPLYRRLTMVLG